MITTRQYKISKYSRIYVYFPQRVVLSTEGFVYEFTELIGEVGGYIGMLLGFSIMDLALTICQLIAKKSEEFQTKNKF